MKNKRENSETKKTCNSFMLHEPVSIEKEIIDEPVDTGKSKRKAKSATSDVVTRTHEYMEQQKGRYNNMAPEDYYNSYEGDN